MSHDFCASPGGSARWKSFAVIKSARMPGGASGGHYDSRMEAASRAVDVAELIARARSAYPQFALDPAAFTGHLSACAGAPGWPAAVSAEDLYLAFAAANRDRQALEV